MNENGMIVDLGLTGYREAYEIQKKAVREVMDGGRERIFLTEHHPVLTLGRRSDKRHILAEDQELSRRGIQVETIDRGGEVTLHAPGQLVAYPILDLKKRGKDLKRYLAQLEETAIEFLKIFRVAGGRRSGKTGVWCDNRKIVSIGVGVKSWVTYHGMGVNINTDLSLFNLINPCGLSVAMTSVEQIMGRPVDFTMAKKNYGHLLAGYFRL